MLHEVVLLITVILLFIATSKYEVNAFLALISVSFLFGIATGMPLEDTIAYIKTGFGDVFYKTGLFYLFGIIIGVLLEKTYAARTISEFILNKVGNENTEFSIALSGFVVSVPVNCDSGFLILSPMCKAVSTDTGMNLVKLNIYLACGLFVTHTMVPPTAGPTTVTTILGADMGTVIVFGLVIGLLTIYTLHILLKRINIFDRIIISASKDTTEIKDFQKNPHIILSFLPIIYPLIMICMNTIVSLDSHPLGEDFAYDVFNIFGDATFALFCAMLITFTLIPKGSHRLAFGNWIDLALREAATIVLINSSAGAFAKVISNSGIIDDVTYLGDFFSGTTGLIIPFLIASIFKIVQGSSTVAMIATAGILGSFITQNQLNPAFYVLAIGAGSMMFSHTNDSFFGVVSQMTGLDVKDMLLYYTIPTTITGLVSFLFINLFSIIFGVSP